MATKTLYQHIEITKGIVGGKPHIKGHRITVQNIVIWHTHVGYSVDEIAHLYHLSLGEIYAALAYYHDNQQVIDQNIQDSNDFARKLQQRTPSKLKQKLNERKN